MAWPNDFGTLPANMQGTTLLADANDGHALMHQQLGSFVNAAGSKLGLSSGTPANNQLLIGIGNGSASWGTTVNGLNLGSPNITGGTITIGTISAPGTVNAFSVGAAIAEGYGSVADNAGGTITVNAQAANVFYCVMGTSAGTRFIGAPLNPTPDQRLSFAFKTSANANGTISFGTIFRVSQNTTLPTLSGVSAWNYFDWRWNSIESRWDFLGQSNYIADALGTIQFDNSAILGQIAGTSLSANFTCTGANGILFAQVLGEVVGTSYISGATYNGIAMTQIGSVRIPSDRWMHLFYLLNPPQGQNTLIVTGTATGFMEVVATSYNGVSGLDGTLAGTNGGSVTMGTLVTTKANDWTVAFIGAQAGQLTAGTTTFIRQYYNDDWHAWFDSNGALAIGTNTLTANNTGTTNQAILMAALSHA